MKPGIVIMNMQDKKQYLILVVSLSVGFLLGWSYQGYYIYKQFYDAGGKMMVDVAKQVNGR